jgi:hypothetical protein
VIYATVDLLAGFDVEASKMMTLWRDAKEFVEKPAVKIGAIVLLALLVILVLVKLVFGRRRYRYGHGASRRGHGSYRGRRRRR